MRKAEVLLASMCTPPCKSLQKLHPVHFKSVWKGSQRFEEIFRSYPWERKWKQQPCLFIWREEMIRREMWAVTYTRFSATTGGLCYWKACTLASRLCHQWCHRSPSRLSSVLGKGGHWLPPAHLQSEHYLGSPFSPFAFFILLIFFTCHLTNKDTSKEGIKLLTILLLLNRNLEICLVREKKSTSWN